MAFNPNELILEKIRSVEEYDPATMELVGRYTQIEQPVLRFTANGRQVVDAIGSEITTFYDAQQGTFDFTNSLHSLDLMASQFGSNKEVASDANKMAVPVSEVVEIVNGVATLTYVPVGIHGAEVKYAKVIDDKNNFGTTYQVGSTGSEGVFVVDATNRTLTFPEGTTGRVFVQYEKESANAVRVSKSTDGMPEVKTLLIHGIFHDPCNTNLVYAGVIRAERAQINPESVEVNLTSDGKHSASYKLQKPYCNEKAKLVDIIISED